MAKTVDELTDIATALVINGDARVLESQIDRDDLLKLLLIVVARNGLQIQEMLKAIHNKLQPPATK